MLKCRAFSCVVNICFALLRVVLFLIHWPYVARDAFTSY